MSSSESAGGFWSRALSLSSGCGNNDEEFESQEGTKLPPFQQEISSYSKIQDPYQNLPPLEPIHDYQPPPVDQTQEVVPFRYEGVAVPKQDEEAVEHSNQIGTFYNVDNSYYDQSADSTNRGT